ncbi:MAG: TolC family protein [Nitrospirota bacterium]
MKRIIIFSILGMAALPMHAQPANKVEEDIRERTGATVEWQKENASRETAQTFVRKLLKRPLTVSSAVQIALLNNRGLQVTFEEIGIAQANVIEAVTLPNPSVDFDVQFPATAGVLNRYAWLVAQDFVQILMVPLKKKIANEQLQTTELRVAADVLELVAKVKKTYFMVQADQQLLLRLKLIQETTTASLDLSQKQFKAGNTTDLALLQAQAAYSEGRIEITQAETDLSEHKEQLTRLLGLWGTQTNWEIKGDILPVPDSSFPIAHLESLAVSQRLDLHAAHREVTMLASSLGLTKTFRWVPVLEFGFSGERDIDGALNMGPSFKLEIPIFNQGQGRIARGSAELRRSANKLEALAVDIRSEVRENRDKLSSLRDMAVFYHDNMLPMRIQIVNKALLQYNAMQLSPYELFLLKADELKAERGYINTLRDYWITRAELERVVGGTLTPHKESDSKKITPKKE